MFLFIAVFSDKVVITKDGETLGTGMFVKNTDGKYV